MTALCLEPAPAHLLTAKRINIADGPVKERPDRPVCLLPAGHYPGTEHNAGYGIAPWMDQPALVKIPGDD